MTRKTNAARLLDRAGIGYELVPYDLTMEEFSAEAVAEAIGMAPDRVFKTLVTTGPMLGHCFAVVPGHRRLDLRALAIVRGERKMSLAPLEDVAALTGYARGTVTVLGASKPFPPVVDATATGFDTIAVSAGAPGLQMVLAPHDYLAITGALVTGIAR